MNIHEAAVETRSALRSVKRRPDILYVDDDKLLLEQVRSLLRANNLDCQCANGAEEALQMLTSGLVQVDILITDHSMPGMNGLELVRKLRARKFSGTILVYSTLLLCIERETYEDLQVEAIVSKMGSLEALIVAIQVSLLIRDTVPISEAYLGGACAELKTTGFNNSLGA